MRNYVVWLDSQQAHVFALNASGLQKSEVDNPNLDHHTHNKKEKTSDRDNNAEHFFRELATTVKDADQLLILGPGLAKNHFKDHLETHSKILAAKVIGIEPFEGFEHKSENQMLAAAHKLFKQYDLYHNPI
jgi:stalled ribosome rescue protein Dom34